MAALLGVPVLILFFQDQGLALSMLMTMSNWVTRFSKEQRKYEKHINKRRLRIIMPPGKVGGQDQHPVFIAGIVIHACTITAGGLPYQQKSKEIIFTLRA